MSAAGVVAIITIVATIANLPSRRLQALLYSLPIPITIVLIDKHTPVTSVQLVGVVLLITAFYIVGYLDQRLKFPRVLSVSLAAIFYVGAGILLHDASRIQFRFIAGAFGALWALHAAYWARKFRSSLGVIDQAAFPPVTPAGKVTQLAAIASATTAAALLGSHLGAFGGFVVTFPYAGIPVALTLKGNLVTFAREFGFRALGLAGFVAAFFVAQDSFSFRTTLVFGWLGFLAGILTSEICLRTATSRAAQDAPRG